MTTLTPPPAAAQPVRRPPPKGNPRTGRLILALSLAVILIAAVGALATVAYQQGQADGKLTSARAEYDRGHVDGQLQEAEGTLGFVREMLKDCPVPVKP